MAHACPQPALRSPSTAPARWRMKRWSCTSFKTKLWPTGGTEWTTAGDYKIRYSKAGTYFYACSLHCVSSSERL